nr:MAG TPA: hypothetical protein [Bacteriophage sp.]
MLCRLSGWSSVFPLCHNPVKIEAPTQPFNGETNATF